MRKFIFKFFYIIICFEYLTIIKTHLKNARPRSTAPTLYLNPLRLFVHSKKKIKKNFFTALNSFILAYPTYLEKKKNNQQRVSP